MSSLRSRRHALAGLILGSLTLSGCAAIGSLMSPYPERFSCKNSDHGQCIHPDQAYADAVAGRASRSDPNVTNDRKLLHSDQESAASRRQKQGLAMAGAYAGYRDSIYQKLKGLIDAPVTPMLKPTQTVRTLILPYADRQRPDRLYMPRFVYSIVDRPVWVVGGYLVDPVPAATSAPVLGQVREQPGDEPAAPPAASAAAAASTTASKPAVAEPRP